MEDKIMEEKKIKIEVVLLTLNKNPSKSDYIYRFNNLSTAIAFIDLSLENGYEVEVRQTKE